MSSRVASGRLGATAIRLQNFSTRVQGSVIVPDFSSDTSTHRIADLTYPATRNLLGWAIFPE